MTYLLDTNACIALINGTPKEVRRRSQRAVNKHATMLVSSVVAFEMWYGVAKSERKKRTRSGWKRSWRDRMNGHHFGRKTTGRQDVCGRGGWWLGTGSY